MRKLWAAGAAILVCLALGGVPVLAQSPATSPVQMTPAMVTGTSDCSGPGGNPCQLAMPYLPA
jgi:hypothetical protein